MTKYPYHKFPATCIERAYTLYKMGHSPAKVSEILGRETEWHPAAVTVSIWRRMYGWDERSATEAAQESKKVTESMQEFQRRILLALENIQNIALGQLDKEEGGLVPKKFDEAVKSFLSAAGMQDQILSRLVHIEFLNSVSRIILEEISDPIQLTRIATKLRALSLQGSRALLEQGKE